MDTVTSEAASISTEASKQFERISVGELEDTHGSATITSKVNPVSCNLRLYQRIKRACNATYYLDNSNICYVQLCVC